MGGISVFVMLGMFTSVYLIFLIMFLAIIFYILLNYIFESIFLYSVVKRKNYDKKFLCWIPIYNKVIFGDISGNKKIGIWLALIDALIMILIIGMNFIFKDTTLISLITLFLLIAVFCLETFLAHSVFKKAVPKIADILTLLNVFTLGISRPVILFIIRNNKNI